MRRRSNLIPALLALAMALPLAGCGDGNNDNIFIGETPTPVDGRTPTPVRTSTPLPGATATITEIGATATPEETSTVAGPTATATPVVGGCNAGDQVVVVASLDQAYGAARIDLGYPGSLNIPGSGTAQSVVDRVHFAASGGLTTVNDGHATGDVDDTLTASFVGFSENPSGTFVTVTFDCVTGQAPPSASDLTAPWSRRRPPVASPSPTSIAH